MLEHGANVNIADVHNTTPIMDIIGLGDESRALSSLTMLMKSSQNLMLDLDNCSLQSALWRSVFQGFTNLSLKLISVGVKQFSSARVERSLKPSPSVSHLTLVTQTRLDGVKMFHQSSDTSTWEKVASFNINHTGFCRGFIELNDSQDGDVVMVAPSEQSSIMVSKLVQHYMRHIVTLAKTGCGTLMSMSPWSTGDGKLLAGYESGHVVLWDWSNNVQLLETNLSDHLGTCMSLTWNVTRSHGVVTGSEDKIVVLDEQLKVVKARMVSKSF